MVPVATGFTLPADQGVSTRHCANWVVVCVPTGGTISSWRNDPAVSLWVEVSQLCLVMTWLWVGLSLEASREKRCVCSRGCAGRRRGWALVGVRCPHLSVYSLWLPKLTLGCPYYLWISKESLSRFWQRQNCFSL